MLICEKETSRGPGTSPISIICYLFDLSCRNRNGSSHIESMNEKCNPAVELLQSRKPDRKLMRLCTCVCTRMAPTNRKVPTSSFIHIYPRSIALSKHFLSQNPIESDPTRPIDGICNSSRVTVTELRPPALRAETPGCCGMGIDHSMTGA